MAFHDVQFPVDISYGAVGGPKFLTHVTKTKGGIEQRFQMWETAQHIYDVSHAVKTQSELNTLRGFFFARAGRFHTFRYKDWLDYSMTDELIDTATAGQSEFQIIKIYSSGGYDYERTITKIVSGTTTVKVNDVEESAANYDIALTTGIITFDSPGLNEGDEVKVTCEFDVHARFDTDEMPVSIETLNAYTWGEIPIVEIKE